MDERNEWKADSQQHDGSWTTPPSSRSFSPHKELSQPKPPPSIPDHGRESPPAPEPRHPHTTTYTHPHPSPPKHHKNKTPKPNKDGGDPSAEDNYSSSLMLIEDDIGRHIEKNKNKHKIKQHATNPKDMNEKKNEQRKGGAGGEKKQRRKDKQKPPPKRHKGERTPGASPKDCFVIDDDLLGESVLDLDHKRGEEKRKGKDNAHTTTTTTTTTTPSTTEKKKKTQQQQQQWAPSNDTDDFLGDADEGVGVAGQPTTSQESPVESTPFISTRNRHADVSSNSTKADTSTARGGASKKRKRKEAEKDDMEEDSTYATVCISDSEDDKMPAFDFKSLRATKPASESRPPLLLPRPKTSNEDDPTTKANKPFAHVEVVRKKAERDLLPAHECSECEKVGGKFNILSTFFLTFFPFLQWYDALRGDGVDRSNLVNTCSRHKHLYARPSTPPHFWDMDFPETEREEHN